MIKRLQIVGRDLKCQSLGIPVVNHNIPFQQQKHQNISHHYEYYHHSITQRKLHGHSQNKIKYTVASIVSIKSCPKTLGTWHHKNIYEYGVKPPPRKMCNEKARVLKGWNISVALKLAIKILMLAISSGVESILRSQSPPSSLEAPWISKTSKISAIHHENCETVQIVTIFLQRSGNQYTHEF